jgi:hypothetical protein
MKNIRKMAALLVMGCAVLGAANAQGFKLSAGAGGFFGADFGGGIKVSATGYEGAMEMPKLGGGGFLFFDAAYAELNVAFAAGSYTMKGTGDLEGGSESEGSWTSLNIGLLGKYPIALGKITLFPLLGAEYQLVLSTKDENGDEYRNLDGDEAPGDNSALWFRLGVGLDYNISDHLYLRGELLYGMRLASKMENDLVDMMSASASGADVDYNLGHGIQAKLALGYAF